MGEICCNAFSAKRGRYKGVLNDHGIAEFPVGDDCGFSGTGFQFEALLAWVVNSRVGHGCWGKRYILGETNTLPQGFTHFVFRKESSGKILRET